LKGNTWDRAIRLAEYIIDTKNTVRKTAATFGISKSTVSYHVSNLKQKNRDKKVCPICKKNMDCDANYCSRCGTDIRSERDILIESIGTLRALLIHLPENARAKADDITKGILNYLKKGSQMASPKSVRSNGSMDTRRVEIDQD
jgi:hypothetical protein